MANYQIPGAILQDGHSSNRPPYFNGQHYSHWKDRFKIFVQSNDFQAWVVIKKGPKPIPGLTGKEAAGKEIDLESFEITKEQQEVLQTNARAISLLYLQLAEQNMTRFQHVKLQRKCGISLKLPMKEPAKSRKPESALS